MLREKWVEGYENIYKIEYLVQIKCDHDGYYNGENNCTCKPYFYPTETSCYYRQCLNGGVLRNPLGNFADWGCVCPAGFLGVNCESGIVYQIMQICETGVLLVILN